MPTDTVLCKEGKVVEKVLLSLKLLCLLHFVSYCVLYCNISHRTVLYRDAVLVLGLSDQHARQ